MKVRTLIPYAPRRLPPREAQLCKSEDVPSLGDENPAYLQALDLSHAGVEVLMDYAHGALPGAAAGIVAVGALGWGASKAAGPTLLDRVEAAGSFALAAKMALATGGEHDHSLLGTSFGAFHGLVEAGVGLYELLHASRSLSGARAAAGCFQVAKGSHHRSRPAPAPGRPGAAPGSLGRYSGQNRGDSRRAIDRHEGPTDGRRAF
ncbi:MAG: hypothetical protein HY319_20720 [Armatimonadetes bacterium]|nr:hypothetical protein [Armatimonadota bacterium]